MNTNTLSFAAAAAFALLPSAGHAQTTVTYTDNAASPAYSSGYGQGRGGGTPGFGTFQIAATGNAGTFIASAGEGEGGRGTPAPSSIDTNGKSFGLFAQAPGDSMTITRGFSTALTNTGDLFSLDFVTGYNDGKDAAGNAGGGNVGVALTGANGTVGSFQYQSNNQYLFNGTTITGQNYTPGALHLVYDLTSAATYTFQASGAFSFTGTGTFSGPITGFQVQQTNSGVSDPAHNAYFNNLSLTSNAPASAAPEPSQVAILAIAVSGVGGLLLRRRLDARQAA